MVSRGGEHHDPNQVAYNVAAQVTGTEPVDTRAELSRVRAEAGARGGSRSMSKLSADEKTAKGKDGAAKRWKDHKVRKEQT